MERKLFKKSAIILTKNEFRKLCFKAFERDLYSCQLCGLSIREYLICHHLILCSRLHLDILDNLLTLCSACHGLLHKGNLGISVDELLKKYEYRLKGYLS